MVLVEDSNGESEVVALILCAREDEATVQELFSRFSTNCGSTTGTKVVMTDKDFVEKKVLKTVFPCAVNAICLFHVLRTFKREVTTERMGIDSRMRMLILILQKLCYSQKVAQYQETYKDLQDTSCTKMLEYFDRNWHPIHSEWVEGLKHQATTFGNSTNNQCLGPPLGNMI